MTFNGRFMISIRAKLQSKIYDITIAIPVIKTAHKQLQDPLLLSVVFIFKKEYIVFEYNT